MIEQSVRWAAAKDTAARIDRVIREAVGALAEAGVAARLVEGSALSAELSSSDELIRRFASRASLAIQPRDQERAERTLMQEGWQRAEPQGDMHLLRTASRHGRHLVFALLDEDEDGDRTKHVHPSHPEAARLRDARLSRWRTPVRLTLARQQTRQDELGCTITETFELSMVDSASDAGDSGSGQ